MVNKTHAIEWLEKSYHDLDSANILSVSGHYTDTIGYIYHQAIEKIFKAIIAYKIEPIIKSHNLIELYEILSEYFQLNKDDLIVLGIITTYYTKQRYPTQNKKLPTKDEIKKVQELTKYLFEETLKKLDIAKNQIE